MHPIFKTLDIVRCIVREYVSLLQQEPAIEQRMKEQAALALLARVSVFSSHALDILWRDAGVLRLKSLLEFGDASLGEHDSAPHVEDADLLEPLKAAPSLPSGDLEESPERLNVYLKRIKIVLPVMGINNVTTLVDFLAKSPAFDPVALYCAIGSAANRDSSVEAYKRLMKQSLRKIVLYVEKDQPFPWIPLLSRGLPPDLHGLSIASMVPLLRESESGPSLSSSAVVALESALRGSSLHSLQLQCLDENSVNGLLSTVSLLPNLTSLKITSPRLPSSSPYQPQGSRRQRDEQRRWPVLETLEIRDYPFNVIFRILEECESYKLASVSLKTPAFGDGTISILLSNITHILVQRWSFSLTNFKHEGPIKWLSSLASEVDAIWDGILSIQNIRSIHIDSHDITSNLSPKHLLMLAQKLSHIKSLYLSSESDRSTYTSHLHLPDLDALSTVQSLQSLSIELSLSGLKPHLHKTFLTNPYLRNLRLICSAHSTTNLEATSLGIFPNLDTFQTRHVRYVI